MDSKSISEFYNFTQQVEDGDAYFGAIMDVASLINDREHDGDNSGGRLTKAIDKGIADLNANYPDKGPYENGRLIAKVAQWVYEIVNKLPLGYARNDYGMIVERTTSDTGTSDTPICADIQAVARIEGYETGDDGLLFRFMHYNGQWREIVVKTQDLYGNKETCVSRVAGKGWHVEDGREPEARSILRAAQPNRTIIVFERTTGHLIVNGHRIYIAGDRIYTTDDLNPNDYRFEGSSAAVPRTGSGGTHKEWYEGAEKFATDNPRLIFAANTALAGATLEPTGFNGANLYMLGPSSTGKTTALAFGGSTFGSGKTPGGYWHSLKATAGGLEAFFESHHDATLLGDEAGEIDSMKTMAYIQNNEGKQRKSQSGDAKDRTSFRVLALLSGEKEFKRAMEEAKHSVEAGMLVRNIGIPFVSDKGWGLFDNIKDYPDSQAFAEAVSEFSRQQYGTAGPLFIQYVLDNYDDIASRRHEIKEIERQLVASLGKDSVSFQVARMAQPFALIAFVGKLGAEAGIVPWTFKQSFKASQILYKAAIDTRGNTGDFEVNKGKDAIEKAIRTNYSRFHRAGNPANNALGYTWHDGENQVFAFYTHAFQELAGDRQKATLVAKEFDNEGRLQKGSGRNLADKVSVAVRRKFNGDENTIGKDDRFYLVTLAAYELVTLQEHENNVVMLPEAV